MNVRPESERLTSMGVGDLLVADAAATTDQGDESLLTIWRETIENRPRWVQILAGHRAAAVGAVDGFFQELIARDEAVARYWTRPASGSPARVNPGFDARQIPTWFWCPIAACFGLTRQTGRFRWPRSVLPSTARALAAHIGAVSRARVAQVREEELRVLTLQRLISSEPDAQRRAQCLEEQKQDPRVASLVANLGPEHFWPGQAIVRPERTLVRPGLEPAADHRRWRARHVKSRRDCLSERARIRVGFCRRHYHGNSRGPRRDSQSDILQAYTQGGRFTESSVTAGLASGPRIEPQVKPLMSAMGRDGHWTCPC